MRKHPERSQLPGVTEQARARPILTAQLLADTQTPSMLTLTHSQRRFPETRLLPVWDNMVTVRPGLIQEAERLVMGLCPS